MLLLVIQMNRCLVIQHDTLKLHFESLGNHCKLSRLALVMIGRIIFSPGPFMHPHLQHRATSDFNAKLTAMEHAESPVLPWPDSTGVNPGGGDVSPPPHVFGWGGGMACTNIPPPTFL